MPNAENLFCCCKNSSNVYCSYRKEGCMQINPQPSRKLLNAPALVSHVQELIKGEAPLLHKEVLNNLLNKIFSNRL